MKHISPSEAVKNAGGNVVVAAMCEVTSQAVSRWKKYGIPPAQLRFLRLRDPKNFHNVVTKKKK